MRGIGHLGRLGIEGYYRELKVHNDKLITQFCACGI